MVYLAEWFPLWLSINNNSFVKLLGFYKNQQILREITDKANSAVSNAAQPSFIYFLNSCSYHTYAWSDEERLMIISLEILKLLKRFFSFKKIFLQL